MPSRFRCGRKERADPPPQLTTSQPDLQKHLLAINEAAHGFLLELPGRLDAVIVYPALGSFWFSEQKLLTPCRQQSLTPGSRAAAVCIRLLGRQQRRWRQSRCPVGHLILLIKSSLTWSWPPPPAVTNRGQQPEICRQAPRPARRQALHSGWTADMRCKSPPRLSQQPQRLAHLVGKERERGR